MRNFTGTALLIVFLSSCASVAEIERIPFEQEVAEVRQRIIDLGDTCDDKSTDMDKFICKIAYELSWRSNNAGDRVYSQGVPEDTRQSEMLQLCPYFGMPMSERTDLAKSLIMCTTLYVQDIRILDDA